MFHSEKKISTDICIAFHIHSLFGHDEDRSHGKKVSSMTIGPVKAGLPKAGCKTKPKKVKRKRNKLSDIEKITVRLAFTFL